MLIIHWRFVGKPVRSYDRTGKEASSLCVLMSSLTSSLGEYVVKTAMQPAVTSSR
jgi:hypothetical protein